jgi:hypothetical protein
MNTPKLSQSRIFTYPAGLPASKETSFIANRDVAFAFDSATSTWTTYIWTNSWQSIGDFPVKGKDGVSPAVPVFKMGTVTTGASGSEATVSLSSDQNGAILFNFSIPKGEQGEQGPAGQNGTGSGSGPNVGVVRWVSNATELNAAWAGIASGSVRSIHLAADITLNQQLTIPANYSRILEIEGHGCKLVIPAGMTAIGRSYASLNDANAGIDTQLRINNVIFEASNRTAKAIDVQATYGSRIQGCRFYNFDTAIKCGWMMGTVIDQCYFWENNVSIDLGWANFQGGSTSASQSNHSVVRDCKFRHSAGQFGAIKVTAASGIVIEHDIFEGVQNGPQYEVFFDDNGSTVVKEFNVRGCHIEQQTSVAAIHVRLKDGFANVEDVYSQYDTTLVSFDSSGYAKMNVKGVPYLTGGTKFKNINNAGRWSFKDMPATFIPTDAAKWDGAVPSFPAIEGWDTNGQKRYTSGITVKP